jgi:hypothetical protein
MSAAAPCGLCRAGATDLPDLFVNVALVECADAAVAEELVHGALSRFLVSRVSDRVVAVDHERLDDVLKALRRQGQTPKVTRE